MNMIDNIDDKTIFIMPQNMKLQMLQTNQQLRPIKSFTKDELKRKTFFDYDEKTINYIISKYKLKIDIALMYLNNMYYVDDIKYDTPKLQFLVDMKSDLINNNLLIKDDFFLNNLNGKKIVVYGYDYIDKFFKKMLNLISSYATVEIVPNEYKQGDITIYELDNLSDEVNFVAYSISNLLNQGVDINNIKLGNVSEEYYLVLKRIFSFYHIPLNLNDRSSLYGTDMVLSFISLFRTNKDFNDSLTKLSNMYDLENPFNLSLYNKIVSLCNNYYWVSDSDDYIDMLIYDFKKTYLCQDKLNNAVEVVDLKNNLTLADKHVFIMGFNQGLMPVIYKDEEYIADDLRLLLGLETSAEKNTLEKEICLNLIKSLSNVIITYKLKTSSSQYYPSSLIDDLGVDVIKGKTDIKVSYSVVQDHITLSKKLDNLVKYDDLETDIDILYHNYPDILYRTYDNRFKGIDNNALMKHLGSKLKLSYSSIDDYFKCAFKYYISSVMNLKSREESFYLTIGNFFHYVLSHAFDSHFDFYLICDEFFKDKEINAKEQFFLIKLKEELKFVIETIKSNNQLSTFDKSLYEERICVTLPKKTNVTFSGIIDKIMYKETGKTLISLVDYKTGNTDININNIIYGFNMQLPIYLYLVFNSQKFKNPTFVGFYLQEILHNEIINDKSKSYEMRKQEALKLKGYTIDQESLIDQFDSSYKDSRVIKGLKMSNKGFYAYSKILSEESMNTLINLVGEKINEGASDILDGHFPINPKHLGKSINACEYCDFRDMCYMHESDIITIRENEYLFGGEDNE
ncbi:MAG: PD-(D/E)XK nuclease family protein [Bacilli bacterium]